MDKLKDAAYDAEDLLDAIETEGQENEAKDFNTRLEKIVSKLEVIAKEKDILNLKEGQHLLDILLSDGVQRNGVPVIAIVGMGGIGKTTLAQFLFNAERVKGVFDLRAWVRVSEEFDVFKVTKTIYEYATLLRTDIEDLNMLQVTLQTKLKGRRFLLVLDNIWDVRYSEWDLLRGPLQAGAAGSKIIHAFGDRDPAEDSNLKRIGKQIVKKCEGLPLAIKTLGSLLHSEVELEEWNNVLNSRIWDLPDHKSDILPALRLSYLYLPSNVSQTADAEEANLKDNKYIRGLIFEWDIAYPCNGNAQNAAYEPRNRNATVGPSNANLKNAANVPRNRDVKIVAENHHNGNTLNEHSAKGGDVHAANVLDKLQPSENLESLKIKNFLGTGLPNWLGDTSFCKMKSLTLENCRNCSSLAPLGQLPSLQELYIWDMAEVKTVGSEFYGTDGVVVFKSLEHLQFERMDNWEEWSSSINGGFPSLEVLILKECRKLAGLSTQLFPSNLEIKKHECDKLQHQGTTRITLQQLFRKPQPQSS
ncbi:hypothetical protein PTKIN_Ptkin16aG0019400 [Pterospermum kingtungense]